MKGVLVRTLPDDLAVVADELGESHALLRLPARAPEGDVNHESDLVDERPAPEGHQEARAFPGPDAVTEGALPRHDEGERAMDPARAGLARRPEPLRAGLPRPEPGVHARPVTQNSESPYRTHCRSCTGITRAPRGPWLTQIVSSLRRCVRFAI